MTQLAGYFPFHLNVEFSVKSILEPLLHDLRRLRGGFTAKPVVDVPAAKSLGWRQGQRQQALVPHKFEPFRMPPILFLPFPSNRVPSFSCFAHHGVLRGIIASDDLLVDTSDFLPVGAVCLTQARTYTA